MIHYRVGLTEVPPQKKEAIRKVYRSLDVGRLKEEMERLQEALERSVWAKRRHREKEKSQLIYT